MTKPPQTVTFFQGSFGTVHLSLAGTFVRVSLNGEPSVQLKDFELLDELFREMIECEEKWHKDTRRTIDGFKALVEIWEGK